MAIASGLIQLVQLFLRVLLPDQASSEPKPPFSGPRLPEEVMNIMRPWGAANIEPPRLLLLSDQERTLEDQLER